MALLPYYLITLNKTPVARKGSFPLLWPYCPMALLPSIKPPWQGKGHSPSYCLMAFYLIALLSYCLIALNKTPVAKKGSFPLLLPYYLMALLPYCPIALWPYCPIASVYNTLRPALQNQSPTHKAVLPELWR